MESSDQTPTPGAQQGEVISRPRVLIVEDDDAVRRMIMDFLSEKKFDISIARNGAEGLQLATTEKPSVILADIVMPEMNGIEMIRQLRKLPGTMLIPVIALTAVNTLETKIEVFSAGADGIMIKPFDLMELQVRIERAIQISDNFMKLTYVDALTGVYNRRLFDDRLPVETNRARRYKQDLSLVMIDIDHFKKFNDTYGHRAGDFVLGSLAQHVKKSLRAQDLVCRYGGEEFSVIMPATKSSDAAMVMSRIRADLQDRYFYSPFDDKDFNIRISVGIANFPENTQDFDMLIRLADEALYEAKTTGRNKVVIYTSEISKQKAPSKKL